MFRKIRKFMSGIISDIKNSDKELEKIINEYDD